VDDLAAIAETLISTHREGARPLSAREARVTALILVGAGRSIIESWLEQAIDLSRDDVASWTATVVVGIIDAVSAQQR
jgi:hypothetical protein